MFLELLVASGLVITSIVGAGDALEDMDREPQITNAVEVPSLLPSAKTTREKHVVPIDTLSELKEEKLVAEEKIPVGDETKSGNDHEVSDTRETPAQPLVTPASFVVPDGVGDGSETTEELDTVVAEESQTKTYNIFEAVGFEDDEDFDDWAK